MKSLFTIAILFGVLLLVGCEMNISSKEEKQEFAMKRVTAVNNLQKARIESYFSSLKADCQALAGARETIAALNSYQLSMKEYVPQNGEAEIYKSKLREFYGAEFSKYLIENSISKESFDSLYSPQAPFSLALQYGFIVNNPYSRLKRKNYEDFASIVEGRSSFNLQKRFNELLEIYSLDDAYIVDAETGIVLYTVKKRIDLGTDLKNGPLQSSGLGDVFESVSAGAEPESAYVSEFEPYLPDMGAIKAFVGYPINRSDTSAGGVLIFAISPERLYGICNFDKSWEDYGLGETGQTFVARYDSILITNPREYVERPKIYSEKFLADTADSAVRARYAKFKTPAFTEKLFPEQVGKALAGNSGAEIVKEGNVEKFFSAFAPLDFGDMPYAVITVMNYEEIFPIKSENEESLSTEASKGFGKK